VIFSGAVEKSLRRRGRVAVKADPATPAAKGPAAEKLIEKRNEPFALGAADVHRAAFGTRKRARLTQLVIIGHGDAKRY